MLKNKISIIGGAGHIGLPLSIKFSEKKFIVNIIDVNLKNLGFPTCELNWTLCMLSIPRNLPDVSKSKLLVFIGILTSTQFNSLALTIQHIHRPARASGEHGYHDTSW